MAHHVAALPASSFYVAGGTLHRDAPSYVLRKADTDLLEGLRQGQFCYVLTSRQMGKSSLMIRTAVRLREEGIAVAILDLTAIGQNLTPEQWYDGLLSQVGQDLHLEDELEDFWLENERVGPLQRWMRALREVVLARVPGRIVLFVDEIDAVRSLPFSTDEFFAGIRECYNRRTEDPEMHRLTFCLLGVASPSDLIRDTRTTPFNIGKRIELNDFTEAEAAPLAAGLSSSPTLLSQQERVDGSPASSQRESAKGQALLQRILYWTGGHPYLTQRLCQAVAEDAHANTPADVDRLCAELFLSARARERDDNLLFVRERLLRSEADLASLLDLYDKVRSGKHIKDDETNPLISLLRLSGIIRVAQGALAVRNRIYFRVFDREWVASSMPDAERARQRAAYRKGLLRAIAVSGVILLIIGSLALSSFLQARAKERALALANQARLAETQAAHLAARKAEEAQQAKADAEQQRDKARSVMRIARLAEFRALMSAGSAQRSSAEAKKNAQAARRAALLEREAAEQARIAAAGEKRERRRAQQGERIARHEQYAAQMNLAQQAWEANNIERVQELLAAQKPARGQEDVRGFEWGYLYRLCHQDLFTFQGHAQDRRLWQPDPVYLDKHQDLFSPQGHTEGIHAVAFFPDGKTLVTGSMDGSLRFWNLVSKQATTLRTSHKSGIYCLALSPDGKILATGSKDSTVKLWDVPTHREIATLPEFSGWVFSVAFSPDGKLLATGSWDGAVQIWSLSPLKQLWSHRGYSREVDVVTFSPDGKTLAFGCFDGTVKLLNVATHQEIATLKGHTIVKLLSADAVEIATLRGHRYEVDALRFSPDGKTLASGSQDSTVKLWSLNTFQEVGTLRGHRSSIYSIVYSPDGKILATGSEDTTVRLWNPATQQELATFKGHTGSVVSVAFSPDGKRLASGSWDGTMKLWRVGESGTVTLKGHAQPVTSVALSPDGKLLATGSQDHTVRLWSTVTGREVGVLNGHQDFVNAVAFAPDGKILATGSHDNTIKLWSVAARREIATLSGHSAWVYSVAFAPDGKRLASGSWDGVLKLWNVATRRQTASLKGHSGPVNAVAFSPDGTVLATVSSDGTVKLWSLATKRVLATLTGHNREATCVAFSHDGRLLATGSGDGTVQLWTLAARPISFRFIAHAGGVFAVAISPDGKTLATGGRDSVVKLWSTAVKQEVALLRGHSRAVHCLVFSADGRTLATGSDDATAKLWTAAPIK